MHHRTWLLTLVTVLLPCCPSTAATFPEQLSDSQSIRDEQYRQIDAYFEARIKEADAARAHYWTRLDFSSLQAYDRSTQPYRDDWAQFLAVPSPGNTPLNPKRIELHNFDRYTAYRVWFDSLPGVQAYGILLVPKKPGRKPAVICIHGHEGTPEHVAGILPEETIRKDIYRGFGRMAVERGFVAWCPYILEHYSEERQPQDGPHAAGRDLLQKKALLAGRTLMGLEVAKICRGVDYLSTLSDVDPQRIGIYGLSKGGHYTLYTAGIETRIKAAVVSGWFNDRTKKLTLPKSQPNPDAFLSRVHRSEYFLTDLLDRFGDAELAWMIAPRPLMIEAGTRDQSVNINFVREEFKRVQAVYEKLGIADRIQLAPFEGPHQIDGTQSFPFLDKWLQNERSK